MAGQEITVGLVGAGYIAAWHAAVLAGLPGVRLAAVCDPAPGTAEALAGSYGARAFASMSDMQAAVRCDALHILTPPQTHRDLALEALAGGAHVLVEKPFALSPDEAAQICAAADAAGRCLAVNHNFLGLPAYDRLKAALADGRIGRVDSADIHWRFPLPPLRSGPFGLWMLRRPENLLLELGPHLYAFALDLFGPLEDLSLRLSRPVTLPGGVRHHQGWTVLARAGGTDLRLAISLVEGMDDRSVGLRGVAASARLDYAADTLVIARPNAADIVLNPLRQQLDLAAQHLGEGLRNAWVQGRSLNRRSPYALGFEGVFRAFHAAIRSGRPVDPRFSGAAALAVSDAIAQTLALLPAAVSTPTPTPAVGPAAQAAPAEGGSIPPEAGAAAPASPAPAAPKAIAPVLVIGGTGFVGRALTRRLVADGRPVRVLSRSPANPFADLGAAVQIVPAALHDAAALRAAMEGIDTVVHLARADEATWEGYLQNDVAVTEALADAALDAGVRRFVYTGTIASYDASRPDRPITEDTPFGDMTRRNLYARSKALCEARLEALHRDRSLPLVIARPGIVLGPGGPLQHWGIGRWHGAGAVRIWGDGRNPLPFVLNQDVADGLVRMIDTPGIEGQSFNLVGPPILSARDYFDLLAQHTGTRIRVASGRLTLFYLGDLVKYLLKRHVLRRGNLVRPLLIDWKSRAHLSPFGNKRARTVLGWQPEDDPQRLARRACNPQDLFGF